MDLLDITNQLNQKPFREFKPFFSGLNAVDPQTLCGRFAAAFVGPGWLRTITPPSLAMLGFRNWCGKRFIDGGLSGENLFGKDIIREKYPFVTSLNGSVLDDKTSLVIQYSRGCPFPWMYVIDELRQLDETRILGMTILNLKRIPKIPFPFILYPWEN